MGLKDFQVERLLTIAENFYEMEAGQRLHQLNIIYQCRTEVKPHQFQSLDAEEISPKGIRWLPICTLVPETCTSRIWTALQAANLI